MVLLVCGVITNKLETNPGVQKDGLIIILPLLVKHLYVSSGDMQVTVGNICSNVP